MRAVGAALRVDAVVAAREGLAALAERAVGAALANRCFNLGWAERMRHSRAVIVTAPGRRGFLETFGISVPNESGSRTAQPELDGAVRQE